jgi:hypothetical protein
VDAERAFALKAQADGQWQAFLAFAAPDAIVFAPGPVKAHDNLKDLPEPPVPVMWWPATVFAACDGGMAVNTGPWVRAANGSQGSFTTIWQRQGDGGWKWLLDHGRETPRIVPAGSAPAVKAASCGDGSTPRAREDAFTEQQLSLAEDSAGGRPLLGPALTAGTIVQREGAMPEAGGAKLPAIVYGARIGGGHSADWTLVWDSHAIAGKAVGAHDLRVWQWRGPKKGWALALYEVMGLSQ